MAFASIRQYRTTDAAEVGRRAADEDTGFVPVARDTDGIDGWYLVDPGDGTIVTITICKDQAAADESVEKAREWVGANAAELVEGAPTVTSGEITTRA